MYSNLKGCDGQRMYFDGASTISMNGDIYTCLEQFSASDIEVGMATLDLEEVRLYRRKMFSRQTQASEFQKKFNTVKADIQICREINSVAEITQKVTKNVVPDPMHEIELAPALWLWDYLRRSGARGFFIPLSGGSDSASVAAIVASMCRIIFSSIQSGNSDNLAILRQIVNDPKFMPKTYQEIVNQILVTSYLGTTNSSKETLERAKRVAEGIGSYHFEIGIDEACQQIQNVFEKATNFKPKFEAQGGSYS